ncbi:proteasome assembly chaperone 1 [Xenopus laevis]|uniref:Proteasome assembly chaperone 1 n=2 Tax=Xenopus laevis TaxID=8355 RepID=PSMG1_XENLA|nr:proteasome assembly chaperone 1 [Xenopus laevis]Q05AX3.1 RecName: Full=Proteasome assembly chaperone 1 [Xenopus laevis]AAI23193.1 Psmg1 protein [Xenopus laevis]
MATFFGEVQSVFSRAVDEEEEDEDDDEEEEEDREIIAELERKREVRVTWNPELTAAIESSPGKRLPCSSVILSVGDNATGFVSSYILSSGSWEVAGSVTLWNERCRDCNVRKDFLPAPSSCTFYRSITDPTVLLCQCNCHVAEDQLFQWCEKVFGSLEKSSLKVTVLSTCPVSEYKTPESTYSLPVPFLKALRTSEYREEVPCPLLEQPNIVDGLPAAVLSHCQVLGIPAVFYQCYTDISKLDSVTIKAFRPLLSSGSLSRLAADSANIQETLRKTVKLNEIQSNLYI